MKISRPGLLQGLLMATGLVLTFLFAWHANQAGTMGFSVLDALERDAYDFRLRQSAEQGLDPRVIIIDIDEESLIRVGQWPWPRTKIAQLLENLFTRYEVDTLGFDVVFAEPEMEYTADAIDNAYNDVEGIVSAEAFKQALSAYQGDQILAEALKGRSVVLGYFFEGNSTVGNVGSLPAPLFSDASIVNETEAPVEGRYSGNIPQLQSAAGQAGFFSLASITDVDGIIRRVALLNKYDNQLYAALPLVMAQQFFGAEAEAVLAPVSDSDAYLALEALDMGLGRIGLDSQAAVFVPYRQPQDAYRYVPAWQVLENEVSNPDDLAGTLVLVGTSASGLVDLRNTPLQNAFPGVEIHASLLSGILDGQFRSQPGWTRGVDVASIFILGTLLALWLPMLSIGRASLLTALCLSGFIGSNVYFWYSAYWVVPLASICVLLSLLYLLNVIVGFFAETRSRKIMRRMFGLYIPSEIVDEMSATPDVYSLKSEKRDMTVMFSDVRGFTTISEALSPEALSELLNTLLTPITEIIHRHRGAIDKYMGDAVMAFWGAPVPVQNHASQAIASALEMSSRLTQINDDFASRDWPEMRMGIGISTGEMSVGNMGSEFRMAYTVLGDSVNLGSRLEGLTSLYGVDVIVSEQTRLAAPEYVYRELDIVRVKGKQNPEKIFCPLGTDIEPALEKELMEFAAAIAHYRTQAWPEARAAFDALNVRVPCILYALYLERIEQMRNTSRIETWDGVTNLTHK